VGRRVTGGQRVPGEPASPWRPVKLEGQRITGGPGGHRREIESKAGQRVTGRLVIHWRSRESLAVQEVTGGKENHSRAI
jgi:hypothetical protein